MAMSIGDAKDFCEVDAKAFDVLAGKCDINPKFMRGRIERMSDGLFAAVKEVSEELADSGHPSSVYGKIADLAERHVRQLMPS